MLHVELPELMLRLFFLENYQQHKEIIENGHK